MTLATKLRANYPAEDANFDIRAFGTAPGEEMLELQAGQSTASVSLWGAQVMSFNPGRNLGEVLWTGSHQVSPGKDCWGGIPLCWPWFMSGQGPSFLGPFHGPARLSKWKVVKNAVSESGVTRATLELKGPILARDGTVFPLDARLVISLSHSLHLELITKNTGDSEVTLESCFHAYFRVGDVNRVRLQGLEGTSVIDQLAGDQVTTPISQAVTASGPASRIFRPFPEILTVEDPVLQRQIELRSGAASQLVLWNSGPVRSENGRTTGEPEWRTQLALEPLRGIEQKVTLAPGESTSLDLKISVHVF